MAVLSGILVKDQAWSGLPIGATDMMIIRNCNFNTPIHPLAVNSKNSISFDRTADSNHNKINTQPDQVHFNIQIMSELYY